MGPSKALGLSRISASSTTTKVCVIVGVGLVGVIIVAETRRWLWKRVGSASKVDFGAFLERFELIPSPQPPPPAARHPLSELTFAISDCFDVEGFVVGFGNPDWKRTHEPAKRTALVVSCLLKHGAKCVGRTIMDEFALGITGENAHYGTPTNPVASSHIPGGPSSGAAVAVAAKLVDFSLGTDTVGSIIIPATYCGVFGFRLSHGIASTAGILTTSKSLDALGLFARDASVLHRVGHVLLQTSYLSPRRMRRFVFADDCFELSRVPRHKTIRVICKAVEKLFGYQSSQHLNIGQYISSNVPSLKEFHEQDPNSHKGIHILKVLAATMLSIQRYEFKTEYEEWINQTKPKFGPEITAHVLTALKTTPVNNRLLYKVRTELRAAMNSLLEDEGILVIPTYPESPLKLNCQKKLSLDFEDKTLLLSSIAGMSGCCEVSVPVGIHDDYPISISFIAPHGSDKFLLDTVLDINSSLQEQVSIALNEVHQSHTNGDMDASELLKEKGNAAFKGRQWNKAISYYSEAIKLNDTSAVYYCNRAAAYLELGCFQQAEADCNKAILLDRKNVKAYLRRGTAREMLLQYNEASLDFKHALVLEPQNKAALAAEKRLRKLIR